MTILTLNKKELEKQIGKIDEKIEERITMLGPTVETSDENEISMEIFPNRPDLLSLQGISRAMLAFLSKKPGLKTYKVETPLENYEVIIEKSVKKVRPFTACAIVKGLKLDDSKIKEIIDIQEKLHLTIGRKRKKIAIGIYPLEKIKLPIRFLGKKPEDIKFQPLEFPRELTGKQILSQHPAGKDYADLLKDAEVFPIFQDENKNILSMPPIINSQLTGKINEKTTDVFIECSGFNLSWLKKTLNIIVCALADMGGKIYSMKIKDSEKFTSPNLEPERLKFSIETINKNLGLNLSEKEIKKLLEKMGINYESEKNNSYALIPAYRADILHEIDLVEEVALAYGYENFESELPKTSKSFDFDSHQKSMISEISTIGEENKLAIFKRKIANILAGLGLLETSSFHISTKEKQFNAINKNADDIIELIDSKTENNILRTSLLAQSINILSQNSDAEYPQKIFELGRVFESDDETETQIKERESLCISLCDEKANFTNIKQVLDYLAKMLDIKYTIKETEDSSFIKGRAGKIIIEKQNQNHEIGIIGEIAPIILKNNKIKMPVASLEIDVDMLMS